MALAEALGWDSERVKTLRYAALLHDIGKIGVPDSILNNPKRLSDVEYGLIKSHTDMGGDILSNGIMTATAEHVARSHHERVDGNGYPLGLKGDEIPEEARIVAIADAFDAMSSNRIYRKACDPAYIRRELLAGKGRQFDPELTDRFIALWDQGVLDPIMDNNAEQADETGDAPSDLLREVVDAFLSQAMNDDRQIKAAPEGLESEEPAASMPETADVGAIVSNIQQSGTYSGALKVEFLQFARLYEYICNLDRRFSHPFRLILISLDLAAGETPQPVVLEREMGFMERSIRMTIRSTDILTRYGSQQFLVILMATDPEGARTTVDRIFRDYFKINGSSVYMPSYIIAEIENTGDGDASQH